MRLPGIQGINYSLQVSLEGAQIALKNHSLYKVSYDYIRPNFGDTLNKYLFSYLLPHYTLSTYQNADIIACGSLLNYMDAIAVDRISFYNRLKPIKVWGSGFIDSVNPKNFNPRRPLEIHCARGQKSMKILESLPKVIIKDNTVGDPALLFPILVNIKKPAHSLYPYGVVLHYSHANNIKTNQLSPNIKIIDVTKDPLAVVQDISECENIISTSLHGIIIGDALGKNTVYAKSYPPLIGGSFKFEDYYSSLGFDQLPFPDLYLRLIDEPEIRYLTTYSIKVNPDIIRGLRSNLIDSFPFLIDKDVKKLLRTRIAESTS